MTDAAAKLAKLKREVRREWRPLARRIERAVAPANRERTLQAALLGLVKVAVVALLPFIIYVRASVDLYFQGGLSAWSAILGASLITASLAFAYGLWLSRRFVGKKRAGSIARWVALPLAVAWCGYAALYLSRVNAKSDDVRAYYRSVHPVLRVAIATAVLGDPDIVITDARRVATDYARMGLPVNERTKHYVQRDGYVHAVDLRTRDRNEIRNRATQLYFWMMGFDTLRHVGTADHLHVQLRVMGS
jgi:hypothetical protein